MHLPIAHSDNPGPRPLVKIVGGVQICESAVEMKVRMEGLRKPGDLGDDSQA